MRVLAALLCCLLLSSTASFAKVTKSSQKPGSAASAAKNKKAKVRGKRSARRGAWKRHGQQAIKEERTREIQRALVREKYLAGEATGDWDQRTQEAMRRYQGDNGWQSKVLPDARALIKLGLGPTHAGLLNPETAAATLPAAGSGGGTGNQQQD